MCMKFVNATISCYDTVTLEDSSSIKSFNNPIDVLSCCKLDSGNLMAFNLSMVTQISIRGTLKTEDYPENILHRNGSIDIIIRLTKCDADENNRLYVDLDSFTIDLAEERRKGNVKRACFDYFNHVRVTNIAKVQLPANEGNYVLKILIRESGTNDYSIQSMSSLRFKLKESR